jgi:hypothetical protein
LVNLDHSPLAALSGIIAEASDQEAHVCTMGSSVCAQASQARRGQQRPVATEEEHLPVSDRLEVLERSSERMSGAEWLLLGDELTVRRLAQHGAHTGPLMADDDHLSVRA